MARLSFRLFFFFGSPALQKQTPPKTPDVGRRKGPWGSSRYPSHVSARPCRQCSVHIHGGVPSLSLHTPSRVLPMRAGCLYSNAPMSPVARSTRRSTAKLVFPRGHSHSAPLPGSPSPLVRDSCPPPSPTPDDEIQRARRRM